MAVFLRFTQHPWKLPPPSAALPMSAVRWEFTTHVVSTTQALFSLSIHTNISGMLCRGLFQHNKACNIPLSHFLLVTLSSPITWFPFLKMCSTNCFWSQLKSGSVQHTLSSQDVRTSSFGSHTLHPQVVLGLIHSIPMQYWVLHILPSCSFGLTHSTLMQFWSHILHLHAVLVSHTPPSCSFGLTFSTLMQFWSHILHLHAVLVSHSPPSCSFGLTYSTLMQFWSHILHLHAVLVSHTPPSCSFGLTYSTLMQFWSHILHLHAVLVSHSPPSCSFGLTFSTLMQFWSHILHPHAVLVLHTPPSCSFGLTHSTLIQFWSHTLHPHTVLVSHTPPSCNFGLTFSTSGIAQWSVHWTCDWKVTGSNPCRSGGRIFFTRVDFLCSYFGIRSTLVLPQ